MLLGCGLLHGSRILSFEQMVMDCEIFRIIATCFRAFRRRMKTLALDVIQRGGSRRYISDAEAHPPPHAQLWLPRLMDRRPYEQWAEKKDGCRGFAGRQRAREIFIATHQPSDPLEPKLAEELKRIITSYEKK